MPFFLLIIDDITNFYYIFKDGYVISCPNKVFDLMIIIFEKSCILFFRLQFKQNHHPGIDNSVCDICMTGICFNSYCNAFLFALCLKFYFCKETKTSAFYILLQLSKTVKCWIYIRLKKNISVCLIICKQTLSETSLKLSVTTQEHGLTILMPWYLGFEQKKERKKEEEADDHQALTLAGRLVNHPNFPNSIWLLFLSFCLWQTTRQSNTIHLNKNSSFPQNYFNACYSTTITTPT